MTYTLLREGLFFSFRKADVLDDELSSILYD